MNVPAIAQKTFEESKHSPELLTIVIDTLDELKKLKTPEERVEYVHSKIEEYNAEVFAHPLVQKLSPCKLGCSACCHTQVSVTDDEARVLVKRILNGVAIDQDHLQRQVEAKNSEGDYYRMSFAERKCIFLDDRGACRVYDARPSVCRTNAVLGDALQCDSTTRPGQMTLVRTPKADLVIYAFYLFAQGGVLPHMIQSQMDLINAE